MIEVALAISAAALTISIVAWAKTNRLRWDLDRIIDKFRPRDFE